jgi:MerR family transcriptional regulator, light-induced transcriptional regulator
MEQSSMSPLSRTPLYNVKAVVQETGLTPDILRAWERRYGVPSPQRSPGGHRLYSQQDIDLLKWLVARKREGLSISHAIELWERMAERGLEPVLPKIASAPMATQSGNAPATLREEWMRRCMAFDEQGAEAVLAQSFSMFSSEIVCTEILQRGLTTIDDQWYRGQASVQQISFAAQLGTRRLAALLAATPPPLRSTRLLLGCPPEEEHTFGVLLLSLLLRRQGWDVLYLGSNVPLDRLEQTLASTHPNLVVLSAQQLFTAATLMETAQLINQAGVTVAYGGRIFNLAPDLRSRIQGYFLGERLVDAPPRIESLVYKAPGVASPEPPGELYQDALAHYRLRHPLIEGEVRQLSVPTVSRDHLVAASLYLARCVQAALALGDVHLLDGEIDWLLGLFSSYRVPVFALHQYLTSYDQAARMHLDQRGGVVLDWLSFTIDRLR